MGDISGRFYKRDYWIARNLSFARPHFRLEKCGRLVNSIAGGRSCDLLDLGCGPAALADLLHRNINYFGIDIAIQNPGPNFLELDLLENPTSFHDRRFDIIVASGLFEYLGNRQREKFGEIEKALKDDGRFIVTYSNIRHRAWQPDQPWNNFQTIDEFRNDLRSCFHVDRFFATSHNRKCHASTNRLTKSIQLRLNVYIPWVSPMLAVEYFMICSKKSRAGGFKS